VDQQPLHIPIAIEIDYLSDFQYGHLCIFSVLGGNTTSIYMLHLRDEEANMPTDDLTLYLLNNLPRKPLRVVKTKI
jgi:hypothetical protein